MTGSSPASGSPPTTPEPDPAAPRLPADLARLRARFVAGYPDRVARANALAQCPPAFRHVLSLVLDLDRADSLPRHYRDLTLTALAHLPPPSDLDAVEHLVFGYAAAAAAGADPPNPAGWLPRLRRYFTEPQVIELVLFIALTRALTAFDRMLAL